MSSPAPGSRPAPKGASGWRSLFAVVGNRSGTATLPAPRPVVGSAYPLAPWLVIAAGICGSLIAGATMTRDIQFGVAFAVALCYVPLALLNIRLAIILWLPTASLVAVPALDIGPAVAGIMIALAWLGALGARHSNVVTALHERPQPVVLMGALLVWVMVSMAWAPDSAIATAQFYGWLAAFAIVLILPTVLIDRRYLQMAIGAFVVGTTLSVVLGMTGVIPPVDGRLVGGSGDANDLAAGIVPAIVLAAGLGAISSSPPARLVAVGTVTFLTIGLVASASRGGLAAGVVAMLAVIVLAKHHRLWVVALTLCIAGIAGTWLSVDSEASDRLSSLDSTGRTELWDVSWQMWQDHPVAGVGLQGFQDEAPSYAREGVREHAEFLVEEPKVVHNTYLELLAEAGVVGFLLFLAIVSVCLRCAWRAANTFSRAGDAAMASIARSSVAAMVAMLGAAFFISAETDPRLWVLLSLGPALLTCAERPLASRAL
jgi:O-antigen ligase